MGIDNQNQVLIHTVVQSPIDPTTNYDFEPQQSTACELNDDTSAHAAYLNISNDNASKRDMDGHIIGMAIVISPSNTVDLLRRIHKLKKNSIEYMDLVG